jgi:hypothetical protein
LHPAFIVMVHHNLLRRWNGTLLAAYPLLFEEAIDSGVDLRCDLAIWGVDNNPARIEANRYFRSLNIPVIFTAVSADADHGNVFVQEATGPCFGCLFPDAVDSRTYACPAFSCHCRYPASSWSVGGLRSRYYPYGQAEKGNYRRIFLTERRMGYRY